MASSEDHVATQRVISEGIQLLRNAEVLARSAGSLDQDRSLDRAAALATKAAELFKKAGTMAFINRGHRF